MRGLILLISLLILSIKAHAQLAGLPGAEAPGSTVIDKTPNELLGLVRELINPEQTELEKARVLFVWTATNIHYNDSQVKPYL
ncbi:MAG: hypothetical protein LH609_06645, partial [Rudanella sp.]|nr:hypothetical protein [Rudanella sp.]